MAWINPAFLLLSRRSRARIYLVYSYILRTPLLVSLILSLWIHLSVCPVPLFVALWAALYSNTVYVILIQSYTLYSLWRYTTVLDLHYCECRYSTIVLPPCRYDTAATHATATLRTYLPVSGPDVWWACHFLGVRSGLAYLATDYGYSTANTRSSLLAPPYQHSIRALLVLQ